MMNNLDLKYKQPCIQCGNKTMTFCKTCRRFLCGRCKTKKPIRFPLSKVHVPSGVCNDCMRLLLTYLSLNLGIDINTFLSKLPEKIEEWVERYL
jgi:plasmid rolling circle replication initiator protein Rep